MSKKSFCRWEFLRVLVLSAAMLSGSCAGGPGPNTAGLEKNEAAWADEYFNSPAYELQEHISIGHLSIPLPRGWSAAAAKGGKTVSIINGEGLTVMAVYVTDRRQGLGSDTAAEFFARSLEGYTMADSVSVSTNGFPGRVIRTESGQDRTTVFSVETPAGIAVFVCLPEAEPVLPWIQVTLEPFSVRHRRNYQFYSFGSGWKWKNDYEDGFLLSGELKGMAVTVSVHSAEEQEAVTRMGGTAAAELFIDNRKTATRLTITDDSKGTRTFHHRISAPARTTLFAFTIEDPSRSAEWSVLAGTEVIRRLMNYCLSIETSTFVDLTGNDYHMKRLPE